MKIIALIASAALLAPAGVAHTPSPAPDVKPVRLAQNGNMTCFNTGEDAPTTSMTKICYYDCAGSRVAITVAAHKLCPNSIKW